MGYAQTVPYAQLDCYTDAKDTVTINNVATDRTIKDIVLPMYTRPLTSAYVDIICNRYSDESHGDNMIVSGYIGITDSGGTLQNAGTITGGALFRLAADEVVHSQRIAFGNIDIAQYLSGGATRTIKFGDITASWSFIEANELYGRVRLYFL